MGRSGSLTEDSSGSLRKAIVCRHPLSYGHDPIKLGHVFRGEPAFDGGGVLADLFGAGRSGDDGTHLRACQEPGERQFDQREAALFHPRGELFNQVEVRLREPTFASREVNAQSTVGGRGLAPTVAAGQESVGQREERKDSKLCTCHRPG